MIKYCLFSSDGGEPDEAETGAQLEDRFYNNKAFEVCILYETCVFIIWIELYLSLNLKMSP